MNKNSKQNITFKFDGIILEPSSNTVTRQNTSIRLEPKHCDVLSLLIRNANEVVSRITLAETVWSDVVVGEEALNRAIFAIRNALGDDARKPKYIETIPRRGYRFVGQLEDTNPPHSLSPKNPILYVGTLCLIAILTVFFAIDITRNEPPKVKSVNKVTHQKGVEVDVASSPNREHLLYVHGNNSQKTLYLHLSLIHIPSPRDA